MLKTFKIKNFKSIIEETIPLTYMEQKAPNGYKEMDSIPFFEGTSDRIISTLLIYGPNAAGKSNLLLAINVLKELLRNGIQGLFYPNRLNNKFKDTSFEVTFIIDKKEHSYLITYDATQIIEEKLTVENIVLFDIRESIIQHEKVSDKGYVLNDFNNLFRVECCYNNKQIKPFLSKLVEKYPGLNKQVTKTFEYISQKLLFLKRNKISPSAILNIFEQMGVKHEDCIDRIKAVLRDLDINITNLRLVQTKEKVDSVQILPYVYPTSFQRDTISNTIEKRVDRIISYHKDINGRDIPFDFFIEESDGTIILFGLIGAILSAVEKGETLFWDEMDSSLHPFLIKELLKMFKSKRFNKTNAQIIATLHNPYILEDENLRISEVAFVDKTLSKGTFLHRIADFEGLRNDNNFRKKYLAGHFGGVPEAYL